MPRLAEGAVVTFLEPPPVLHPIRLLRSVAVVVLVVAVAKPLVARHVRILAVVHVVEPFFVAVAEAVLPRAEARGAAVTAAEIAAVARESDARPALGVAVTITLRKSAAEGVAIAVPIAEA